MRIYRASFVSLAVAMLIGTTTVAMAQEPPAAPPPAPVGSAEPAAAPAPVAATPAETPAAAAAGSKMRLGLNVVPAPFGTWKVSGGGFSASSDTAFAFGIMPFFDYLLSPNFFIGVGPQYLLNVKSKDGGGSAAKELDLQVRIGGGAPVSDKVDLYGYVSPGYSIVMLPSDAGSNPKGFELGLHAGGIFNLSPMAFLNAEVGYQLGFQKVSEGGASADAKLSFFEVGLGGGIHL